MSNDKWMYENVENSLAEHIAVYERIRKDTDLHAMVSEVDQVVKSTFVNKKKVYIAGNGGSCCQAQELEYHLTRVHEGQGYPVNVMALVRTALMSTDGINGGYDYFANELERMGVAGDMFIGFTTSGNSENLIRALKVASKKGIYTVILADEDGRRLNEVGINETIDKLIKTPASKKYGSARVQEAQGAVINLFGNSSGIPETLDKYLKVMKEVYGDMSFREKIVRAGKLITDIYTKGGKIIAIGNGASLTLADHLVEEKIVRFYRGRPGLAAHATSLAGAMSCAWNDLGLERYFQREIEANGKQGDILFVFNNGRIGDVKNLLWGIGAADQKRMNVISLEGGSNDIDDHPEHTNINLNSDDPFEVQQAHLLFMHICCDLAELGLIKSGVIKEGDPYLEEQG